MADIQRCAVYFPVHDVDAAGEYYHRALGFTREYAAGSPTEFAVFARGNCAVMFRRVGTEHQLVPNTQQGGTWDLFAWVDDADALFDELTQRGAHVVYEPTNQDYGIREFAVRDPDGYVLGFGART